MKRNRLSRLALSEASSPVSLFANAFASLGRALLFVSLVVIGAARNAPAAHAQGMTFAWAQTTLATTTSAFGASGVAVDSSGNVFYEDSGNKEVEEIVAVSGSIPANPTIKTVASGFASPAGVAVDGSGNVFVSDTELGLFEILAVNGVIPANPAINNVDNGQLFSISVAVDVSGDLFLLSGPYSAPVQEVLAVNGSIPDNPTIRTLGSGFSNPFGVAVDGSGNVYVADSGNHAVKEILAVDGSIPANPTIVTLAPLFNFGVAVDAKGDVFVTDDYSLVKEILAVDGSVPANPTIETLGSFSYPRGVAVDQKGNVFVADGSVAGRVAELQLSSVNFGSVNVCPAGQATPTPCSNTITLTYNIAAGTTIGGVNIFTAGAKDLDFQAEAHDTSTTLCSAGTYSSATTCTVDVTFAPLASGLRNGTVQIVDGSSNILATSSIYGIGVGPASGHHTNQTITFPTIAPQTALTPLTMDATASSGLPVTFTSNTPTVCTVSGDTATLLTAGSCDVIVTQAGNAEYFATITGQTFLVHHRRQVITFDPIASQPVGTMLPLTGSTDSDLPITYASNTPAVCTVSGATANLLNTGTCTIQAAQAGNATYFPSGPKTVSFTVE
jgi:sugar lactone lactonase YvrE